MARSQNRFSSDPLPTHQPRILATSGLSIVRLHVATAAQAAIVAMESQPEG